MICAESAHINVDECGAPERVGGLKLLTVPTPDGKLTPELVDLQAWGCGDEHRAQPQGRLDHPEHRARHLLHRRTRSRRSASTPTSGAWWSTSTAPGSPTPPRRSGVPLRAFTTDVGVDVLSFGGTKNGLMLGEAVVVLNESAVRGVDFLRKSAMQLASKMRFVSAQFEALLAGDLWLRNARHANAMARRLEAAVRDIPGVAIQRPVQANAVFVVIPPAVTERLQKQYPFYVWDEQTGEVRWMTSFDTTEQDVDGFAAAVAAEMGAA